jgi:phage terminase large subunit GpA-like protein
VTGTEGISVEYWEADRRVFHTWCNTCGWSGNIVRVERMVGHEPEH